MKISVIEEYVIDVLEDVGVCQLSTDLESVVWCGSGAASGESAGSGATLASSISATLSRWGRIRSNLSGANFFSGVRA